MLQNLEASEFHHGDCVGADAEAHAIAVDLGIPVVIHPPLDPKARAGCQSQYIRERHPYVERNHHIVQETDYLIAAPKGPEVTRSGTWATVRYAWLTDKPVKVLEGE